MITIPPPNALGAPQRYSEWRAGQDAACLRAIDTDKRFLALTLPTGAGKSLIYMVSALATGRRTAVLTATKALQTQLLHDFMEAGLVDVRGQVNYRCAEIPGQTNNTAYHGPCHHGYECPRKGGGCEYFDAVRIAGKARLVVTNYAYWISQHKHGEGLGKFDLLVCDEAAEAPEELSRSLTITLEAYDLRFTGVRAWPQTDSLSEWKSWASTAALQVGQIYKGLRGEARSTSVDGGVRRRARELKELAWKLEDLSRAQGQWVVDRRGKSVSLCPLWPAEYAERNLFLQPRVILTSATIRMKTLSLLGIPEDEVEIEDCPSSFPVQNRLVTHIPTVRLNHRSSEADVTVWVMRMDQIIGRRLDRKGIIHTVSYDRMRVIMERSQYRDHMITHKPGGVAYAVAAFRRARAPSILVSPSVTTGVDFPADDCRYQIVAKIPFPDGRDPLVKARTDADPEYGLYLAMQSVVQAAGRGVRCFDTETELLTSEGWKTVDQISIGDSVYGISPEIWDRTGRRQRKVLKGAPALALHSVTNIFRSENEEQLLALRGRGMDIRVTPDHSMVIQPVTVRTYRTITYKPYGIGAYPQAIRHKTRSGLTIVKASDLPARFKIPCAGRVRRRGRVIARSLKTTRDWLRLLGIIISDGHIHKTKACVSTQSKPEGVIWIDNLIARLGLDCRIHYAKSAGTLMAVSSGSVYTRNYDRTTWVFSGLAAARIRDWFYGTGHIRRQSKKRSFRQRKHRDWNGNLVEGWRDVEKNIPRWVLKRASVNQMHALIEGLMVGDGTWRDSGRSGTYFSKDRELVDRLQEMLALSGFRSTIRSRRGQFEVSFCCPATIDCPRNTMVSDAKSAKVWCVSTTFGTVVARRNGHTFIAGNSAEDWCETFVVDDMWSWFYSRNQHLAPGWFREAVRRSVVIPVPMKE